MGRDNYVECGGTFPYNYSNTVTVNILAIGRSEI